MPPAGRVRAADSVPIMFVSSLVVSSVPRVSVYTMIAPRKTQGSGWTDTATMLHHSGFGFLPGSAPSIARVIQAGWTLCHDVAHSGFGFLPRSAPSIAQVNLSRRISDVAHSGFGFLPRSAPSIAQDSLFRRLSPMSSRGPRVSHGLAGIVDLTLVCFPRSYPRRSRSSTVGAAAARWSR